MPHDGTAAPREPGAGPDLAAVNGLVDGVDQIALSRGREDLVTRLAAVRSRLGRSETVVCVVGEFKQGKSALINGLLGATVCPVDDDLATMAVTTVRHGATPGATVHRRDDGVAVAETIAPDDLARWVTERGNPDNRLNVEQVEVRLPHPMLEQGIMLIDTPGIGGLNAAHAAATLAFLPVADALVFVTDASAELTAPELEFLAAAVDAGPLILVALTKVDMYPAWRRILEIDERRLRDIGLGVRPYPLSAALRSIAGKHDDPTLERESGFPPFVETVVGDLSERTRSASLETAFREIRNALDQLREPLAMERQAMERPDAAARLTDDLRTVQERLSALNEAGSHWSVRLDDEFASLRARVEFAFSSQMRQILREAQDEIERIDPGRDWNTLSQKVQQQVAGAVRAAFLETTDGAAEIQTIVSQLLTDEEGAWTENGEPIVFDATSLWQDGQAFGGRLRSGVVAGFGLLAGATVGVEMLGMLGALLGTALVGPALLGAALFFGGREVAGERRRQLTDRRQEARTFVGQFVEDVRFEVDGRLASLGGTLQRDMRARFTRRIGELSRTYQETAHAIERSMVQGAADRDLRLREIRAELAPLDELGHHAAALEAAATRAA
jgi:dynamin family protein